MLKDFENINVVFDHDEDKVWRFTQTSFNTVEVII